MKRLIGVVVLTLLWVQAPGVSAETLSPEESLLERVRTGNVGTRAKEAEALARFEQSSPRERALLLGEARARQQRLQQESQKLEIASRENAKVMNARLLELREVLGPNAAMFGLLQQYAEDLQGRFRNAATSLQYPGREIWLAEFGERMQRAAEIFAIEDLEKVWFLIQQEITASGQIVQVRSEVLGESGARSERELTRIGQFGLITADPQPAYLTWQAESQRASLLKKQPEGQFLPQVAAYLQPGNGLRPVGVDPTAGSLLGRLVDAPSLQDRIAAGGLIGNLILILGAFGVGIAVVKLINIIIVSFKVAAQRRDTANPRTNNPLGRMLLIYHDNKDMEIDTLEMRLGEALLAERPKIDRYLGTVKVISAIAPLMGLMGTVIGMIATFQAITLFGTSDPKTMAGGISQALVTTVEGLTVAIPTVLLHAIASARAAALVNTLKHQTAGLIAERMEAGA